MPMVTLGVDDSLILSFLVDLWITLPAFMPLFMSAYCMSLKVTTEPNIHLLSLQSHGTAISSINKHNCMV